MNELFFVASESSVEEFQKEINAAAADGFKIVPFSVHITHVAIGTTAALSRYECVMAKPDDRESRELKERAAKSGLHVVEGFGV